MPNTDLKTQIAQVILDHHAPGALWQTRTDFFASEDFQKHVLPLLQDVENCLMVRWRTFTLPEIRPLPLVDFGAPTTIPPSSQHGSSSVTQSASMRSGGSSAPITGGVASKSIVHPVTAAMPCAILETAKPSASPVAVIEVAHPERTLSEVPPAVVASPTTDPISVPAVAPALPPIAPQIKVMPAQPTIKAEFQFPNASVGQAYSVAISPVKPVHGLVVKQVQIPEIGLRHIQDANLVSGTPTRDGEFKVEILYSCEGVGLDVAKARLIVNPDPKSLWKNLPSDLKDPYWKPDEDSQYIDSMVDLTLVAGSKRGRSHAQKGTFRDDDFFIYSQVDTGWQIAVVSDGAGSAKFSRRGSAIICKEGGEHLEHALAGEAGEKLTAAVEAWHSAQPGSDDDTPLRVLKTQLYVTLGYAAHHSMTRINEECQRRADLGGTVKDYSSTALFGIVKRFPFGVFCASFSVGDGAIAMIRGDGTPELLCTPDGGEFSGQTRFLSKDTVTQEELLKRLHFSLASDFRGLYLMTDGVSDPYFQTDVGLTMPERWAKLITDIEEVASLSQHDEGSAGRLVTWLDFWSKGEHDDRTLVAIF